MPSWPDVGSVNPIFILEETSFMIKQFTHDFNYRMLYHTLALSPTTDSMQLIPQASVNKVDPAQQAELLAVKGALGSKNQCICSASKS